MNMLDWQYRPSFAAINELNQAKLWFLVKGQGVWFKQLQASEQRQFFAKIQEQMKELQDGKKEED